MNNLLALSATEQEAPWIYFREGTEGADSIVSRQNLEIEGIKQCVRIILGVLENDKEVATIPEVYLPFAVIREIYCRGIQPSHDAALSDYGTVPLGLEDASEFLLPLEDPEVLIREIAREKQGEDAQLQEILRDLSEVDEESREQGYDLCSQQTKDNAKRVVETIYPDFPYRYEIYPSEDREIAVDIDEGHGKGRGVLILCDPDGGAACFAVFGKETSSFRHSSLDKFLNNDFLKKALLEFKERSEIIT